MALAIDRRPGGVLRLDMDRPETLNAFDDTIAAEITEAFARCGKDETVRCVVLGGRGRAFCAGADVNYMKRQGEATEAANLEDAHRFAAMLHAIASCPKPTIARVQGACMGGGVSLACACDFVIAGESARFCVSEARYGLVPANMSPYLIAAVGVRRAQQLAISTLRIDAAHAQAIGLAWKAVPDAELDDAVEALARELRAVGPKAVAEIKALYARVAAMASPEIRSLTAAAFARARASDEGREGLAAFRAKRPPAWSRDG
jgi:methylglutaconyl-CoA hydratase